MQFVQNYGCTIMANLVLKTSSKIKLNKQPNCTTNNYKDKVSSPYLISLLQMKL